MQEFADYLGLSYNGADKKVQKLVNDESLINKIKLVKEFESNRNIKKVIIDDSFLVEIKKEYNQLNEPVKNELNNLNEQVKQENKQLSQELNPEFMQKLVTEIIATKDKLIGYAEQVGQVKLLTDSEKNYKNEYLRLVQENAVLTSKLSELNTKMEIIEAENKSFKEQLDKKSSLFGIFKK